MKELASAIQWITHAFQLWLQCALKPIETINGLLAHESEHDRLSAAIKVWVPSLIVTLGTTFPLLHLYGIEWNNVGHHLSYLLVAIIGLVIPAFAIHCLLRAQNLKSDSVSTLTIYTVLMVTYAPIISMLQIPFTSDTFAAVYDFKQHQTSIRETVDAFVYRTSNRSVVSKIFFALGSTFVTVISTCLSGVVAEAISQWYGNDRFKCYSILIASGLLAALFLCVLQIPLKILVMYAFMDRH